MKTRVIELLEFAARFCRGRAEQTVSSELSRPDTAKNSPLARVRKGVQEFS